MTGLVNKCNLTKALENRKGGGGGEGEKGVTLLWISNLTYGEAITLIIRAKLTVPHMPHELWIVYITFKVLKEQ